MVEALVVLVLAGVVLGSLMVFLTQSTTFSARSTELAFAVDELARALARISADVREATRLPYPATGKGSRPGLGVVNARGEMVFWQLVPSGASNDLVREKSGEKPEVVVQDVPRLSVIAVDLGPGRQPRLLRVMVSRAVRTGGKMEDSTVSLFTSVAMAASAGGCVPIPP